MLGLYISDHPLLGLEHVLSSASDTRLIKLAEDSVSDGSVVTVAGILSGVTRKVTKQGKPWAMATIEDLDASAEALFFPKTYELVGEYLAEDAVVVVKARIDRREDTPRLIALDLSLPDLTVQAPKPVVLSVTAPQCTDDLAEQLYATLSSYPGSAPVHMRLVNGDKTIMLRLDEQLRVQPSPALFADLKALLGPTGVSV